MSQEKSDQEKNGTCATNAARRNSDEFALLQFVKEVENRVRDNWNMVCQFREQRRLFRTRQQSRDQAIINVLTLFHEYPDICKEFVSYYPAGYELEIREDGRMLFSSPRVKNVLVPLP